MRRTLSLQAMVTGFSVQAFDLRLTPIIADHGAYSNVGQKVALCSREHGRSVDISSGL
jgi:hypothetical protein